MKIRYRVTTEVIYEADICATTEAQAKFRVESGDIISPAEVGYHCERELMEAVADDAELSRHCN